MTEPISPLVAQLIQSSYAMTADVTNWLVDSLTEQLAEAHARSAAVEDGIEQLIGGDYMPTPAAIQCALHPSADVIARYRPEERAS